MLTFANYQGYLQYSLEEFRRYQLKNLKRFVCHASKHSRYYKNKISNIKIGTYSDFAKLPLLEQIDLRERDIEEFRASSWENIGTITRSSGTTGKSKIVLWTNESLKWETHWGVLGFLIGGIQKESRLAVLMPLEMNRISNIISICKSIGATAIPIGRITSDLDEINAIELIKRVSATHVLATPTRLHSMGIKILQQGYNTQKYFHVKHILTGGMHSTELQKENLIKLWKASTLFEQAGANELSGTGFECSEHNGLHILPGPHYIEVVDQFTLKPIMDNITPGEILITAFTNLGTPLLRYRVGDLGVISYKKCKCGLSFPRLFIQGRVSGTVTLGGTKLYSYQIEGIINQFLPQITAQYKVTVSNFKLKDLVEIAIEAPQESLEKEGLSATVLDAFLNDAASIYKIINKIKTGEVEISIKLVPMGSLERSNGDKVKDQYQDLRIID